MLTERVCIVGLGLIGGSLALALRPFLSHLAVVESDPHALVAAQGVADVATSHLGEGVGEAGLVILATPVRTIARLLAELPRLRPEGCLVLDVGSTKVVIEQAMEALPQPFQAIGGHPLCGKETAGFAAATADLFVGQTFVLCRNSRSTPDAEKTALSLIQKIGAQPLFLPSGVHDALLAVTSHLPYLIAASLMRTAAALESEGVWTVSASGFRDTSRLAGSSPEMMRDILLTNKAAVIRQISQFQEQLAGLKSYLARDDEAGLAQWLAEAQRAYAEYRKKKP